MAKDLKGFIKFIHSDGKEYYFKTEMNPLTGDQMYTWDNWRGCFASDKRYVKTLIKNILKKATIIETDLR